jgi:hypothetical protein
VLFATIGFFILFYAVYALVAFYVFFSRAGAAEGGSPVLRHLATGAAALLVAVVIAVFDRSVVAQVNAQLSGLKPRAVPELSDLTPPPASPDSLNPAGRLNWRPMAGRIVLAVIIGFFATQAIESQIFSGAIRQQRIDAKLDKAETALQDATDHMKKAHDQWVSSHPTLIQQRDDSYDKYLSALHHQHGQCRDHTQCFDRRDTYNKSEAAVLADVDPRSPQSPERQAVTTQQQRIRDLKSKDSKVVDTVLAEDHEDPLQDIVEWTPLFGQFRACAASR